MIEATTRHPFWGLLPHLNRIRVQHIRDTTVLLAERDRYQEALESIRDQDWVENALDPQWAARIAREALDPDWSRVPV